MTETLTTATHWGTYEAERGADGTVAIRPLGSDPCPPVISHDLADMLQRRARIARPLVRKGYLDDGPESRARRGLEPFVEVGWETALDLAATALEATKQRLGNEGIFGGSYGWASAGRFHHAQSQLKRFLNLAGGFVRHVNTYSSAAAEVIVPHVFGQSSMIDTGHDWQTIARHTELHVCFGGLPFKNAQIVAGGTGPHVDRQGFEAARAAGVETVIVAPMLQPHEEAAGCTWLAPRPNTDVALMLGLAHVLIAEELHDRDCLARLCVGGERLIAYVTGDEDGEAKTPEWAAAICGLDAETIRALARRMAARRTYVTVAWGLQRGDHGEQPFWMAAALGALLGGIGKPGEGAGYGLGTFNDYGSGKLPFRWAAFPQGKAPLSRFIPVARIADALLEPGRVIAYDGQDVTLPEIGLVWWAGGNPFHHHQDLHRLAHAFRRPDTVIVNDAWFQPTCRMADIVLPATTPLERNDFAAGAVGGYAVPMKRLADPYGEAWNDHDIFAEMAGRLGRREDFTEGRDEMGWLRHLWQVSQAAAEQAGVTLPEFDAFWAGGLRRFGPLRNGADILAELRADPDGHPLATPSGRVELYSETIAGFGYADCPGHPAWLAPREWLGCEDAGRWPLHLMSDQPRDRLHSQLDSGEASAAGKLRQRQPMMIHPDDAARRGIADGDVVRLRNGRGSCLAGAVVTRRIRPGVVALSTGAWFDSDEPGNPEALERHGNPNVLTRDEGCSSLSQGPSCNSALVEVERFTGNLPPVEAFDLPVAASRADAAR